ncbi:MAG: hypothetical protein LBU07_00865 [Coriobacteriales bacterium]|nr:hypothetical protein [Coriobacteriales bacterium]
MKSYQHSRPLKSHCSSYVKMIMAATLLIILITAAALYVCFALAEGESPSALSATDMTNITFFGKEPGLDSQAAVRSHFRDRKEILSQYARIVGKAKEFDSGVLELSAIAVDDNFINTFFNLTYTVVLDIVSLQTNKRQKFKPIRQGAFGFLIAG